MSEFNNTTKFSKFFPASDDVPHCEVHFLAGRYAKHLKGGINNDPK